MKENEIKALINLLDDPDEVVYSSVNDKLKNAGEDAIPLLEAKYGLDDNPVINRRIEMLMEDIRNDKFYKDFEDWFRNPEKQNILHGLYYINKLYFIDTTLDEFKSYFSDLRKKVWLELKDDVTGFEAIKILNRYIFDVAGIGVEGKNTGEKSLFFPENAFLNKKISPFPFVGIYCMIADSLELPVYPVYLPGLLIMSYVNYQAALDAYGKETSGVLFYINPYDKGSFLGRRALDYVVAKRNIQAEDMHYTPMKYHDFIAKYLNYLKNRNIFSDNEFSDRRLNKLIEIVNN